VTEKQKQHEVVGCCGIDCGLCPRFQTQSNSACPGCGGYNFKEKHPSCGFLTCCVIKKGLEVCSDCKEYPCKRFDSERTGYDSFVAHKKVFFNLDYIKNNGISHFLAQQKIRIDILTDFLSNYNDGHSKSFFCISCALLPLDKLQEINRLAKEFPVHIDINEKNKQIKSLLNACATALKIKLVLNKK
jgi:hypothetical protein